MTTAEKTNQREAKERLRQLREQGGVISLTRETAWLIIAAGGPTFRTVSGGHRCNQTGARVTRKGAREYSERVKDLVWPRQRKVAATKPKAVATTQNRRSPTIPEIDITNPNRAIYCPHQRCRMFLDYAHNMSEGIENCRHCNRPFQKICGGAERNVKRTQPNIFGYVYCPHCKHLKGHRSGVKIGSPVQCDYCGERFIVTY